MADIKVCAMCCRGKPVGDFGKHSGSRDGRRSSCKECTNRRQMERKAADPLYLIAQREAHRKYQARMRVEQPERVREIRRKADRKRLEIMRTQTPDLYRERWERDSAKRRAAKRGAQHEPYSRKAIFAAYGNTCAYCDAPAEHLDHVIALAIGGADAAHNLLPACADCNLAKGAKTLGEWVESWAT